MPSLADATTHTDFDPMAEIERLTAERDEALEARAHDMARQSSIIAWLRKRRGQLVIERDAAQADVERLRKALVEVIDFACAANDALVGQKPERAHVWEAALQPKDPTP